MYISIKVYLLVECTASTLSKLYDVPVGFVTPSPGKVLYLHKLYVISMLPKGGCCSISDDLSCSIKMLMTSCFVLATLNVNKNTI